MGKHQDGRRNGQIEGFIKWCKFKRIQICLLLSRCCWMEITHDYLFTIFWLYKFAHEFLSLALFHSFQSSFLIAWRKRVEHSFLMEVLKLYSSILDLLITMFPIHFYLNIYVILSCFWFVFLACISIPPIFLQL